MVPPSCSSVTPEPPPGSDTVSRETDRKLLHGVLDTLLLRMLADEPAHGYALCEQIRARSGGKITLKESGVYTALYRLEEQGLIASKRAISERGRETKSYSLTAKGRTHLGEHMQKWTNFSSAVSSVLRGEDPKELSLHA